MYNEIVTSGPQVFPTAMCLSSLLYVLFAEQKLRRYSPLSSVIHTQNIVLFSVG